MNSVASWGWWTLEDLLQVVGEIVDETDITEELIKRIEELVYGILYWKFGRWNDFLNIVQLGDEALTIGGLIEENLGRIPQAGTPHRELSSGGP